MPDYIHRLSQLHCNLFSRQAVKVGQFQNLTPPCAESVQQLIHEPSDLSNVFWIPRQQWLRRSALQVNPFVKTARCQMTLSVQRAMIRVLQEPHSKYPLVRVEACQPAVEIHKDRLHDLFGSPGIFDNPHRYAKDQLVVAVEA